MKKLILIPVVALLAFFSWNCEKDDICSESTPTTPRLVIQFYDINDPTTAKNVTSLLVAGTGADETLGTFSGVSKILLPLRISDDQTQYTFTLNSNNTSLDNTDVLTFNYTREQVFVSRACGYKTIFTLDDATPFVQDDGTDLRWMNNVTVAQPNILNEDEVHVSVLF